MAALLARLYRLASRGIRTESGLLGLRRSLWLWARAKLDSTVRQHVFSATAMVRPAPSSQTWRRAYAVENRRCNSILGRFSSASIQTICLSIVLVTFALGGCSGVVVTHLDHSQAIGLVNQEYKNCSASCIQKIEVVGGEQCVKFSGDMAKVCFDQFSGKTFEKGKLHGDYVTSNPGPS